MNNSTLVHINQLPPTIYGRPVLLMQRFRHDLTLARLSILRVRFLLHVTALNSHTSCFHASPRRDRSPECRLCDLSVPEDIFHSSLNALRLIMYVPCGFQKYIPHPQTLHCW